jgi:hypothetical protein
LLAWFPLSPFIWLAATLKVPTLNPGGEYDAAGIELVSGALIIRVNTWAKIRGLNLDLRSAPNKPYYGYWGDTRSMLLPKYANDYGSHFLLIPLWLLAFICLAWPVTSFIVARRRRKGRGFEVEARPGAAVPPSDS